MDVFHYFSKRFIWEQRFALTADGLTYLSAVLLLILTVQALIPSRFALSGCEIQNKLKQFRNN